MKRGLALLTLSVLLGGSAYAQRSGPAARVSAFYKFDRANSQIFNRKNVDARKQWLSTELYELLLKELERQDAFLKQNPDEKPYFGDGLPFQPLDEVCEVGGKKFRNRFTLGTVTVKGEIGNVDVRFSYPAECDIDGVLYAVHVSKEKGRWVIDDILYPDSKRLTEILNRSEY